MPLDAAKIKALRGKVSKKSKKSVVKHVSEISKEADIVFIIAAILEDIVACTVNQEAVNALKEMITHFKEVGAKLSETMAKQLEYLNKIEPIEIKTKLEHMVELASRIDVTFENNILCQEASLWIQGLYQFTARHLSQDKIDQYQKDPDHFEHYVDLIEDRAFYKLTKNKGLALTKYHVAYPYSLMAAKLDQSILTFTKNKDKKTSALPNKVVCSEPLQTQTKAISTPLTTVEPTAVAAISEPKEIPAALPITFKDNQLEPINGSLTSENQTTMTTARIDVIPTTTTTVTDTKAIESVLGQVPSVVPTSAPMIAEQNDLLKTITTLQQQNVEQQKTIMSLQNQNAALQQQIALLQQQKGITAIQAQNNTLTGYLLANLKTKDDDKVNMLKTALAVNAQLTPEEEAVLSAHMHGMVSHISNYANSARFFSMFGSKVHAQFAKEMVEKINEETSISHKLQYFLDLCDDANGLASNTLKPDAMKACVVAYNALLDAAKVRAHHTPRPSNS